MHDAPKNENETGFLTGSGEMAALMRKHDWAATPLGPPESWPQSVRTVVRIMLTSRYAMWMGWGEDLTYFYNESYAPTLGRKHPWALGKPAREVWAEIWPDIGPRIDHVLKTGEATWDEGLLLFLERAGFPEETYHTFSYSPLPDDSGGTGGMLCVVTEETERVIAERRVGSLRELAAELAAAQGEAEVLNAVQASLTAADRDMPFALLYLFEGDGPGRLARAARLERGHAAAPAELLPGGIWQVTDPAELESIRVVDLPETLADLPTGAWERPPAKAALVPVAAQGQERRLGLLVVGLNPHRMLDADYTGFLDLFAGQTAAGLVGARAYEEERRRAEALAELDRAKTAFFSNVSHEFRTPLTLMLGPLEEALAHADRLPAEERQRIDIAHRNSLRLLRLVNSLLDFSRVEAGRLDASYEPVDLAAFTAELASNFRAACERAGLTLTVEAQPLSQPVYVDRDMWEKIVLNLMSNAFKFTLEGGITVSVAERDGAAVVEVRDTGSGIAEADLPRLFERFSRIAGAKGRSHEGSGIGLALVQELVTLHGGAIAVESAPGEGTTFSITLRFGSDHLRADRIKAAPGSLASSRAPAFVEEALRWLPDQDVALSTNEVDIVADKFAVLPAPAPGKRARIVLADDNADMRNYVRRLLSDRFDIEPVGDGEAALAAVRRERPDLLLTDVMMPRLDGFGLLRAIRSDPELAELPVVMLSARAGEEAQVEGIEAGADDYLVKPFSARELIARVTSTLELSQTRRKAEAALRQLNERLSNETERFARMFQQAPSLMALLRGPEHVFELANPAYLELTGPRDLIGKPAREALPDVEGQGFFELLDQVYQSGEAYVGTGVRVRLQRSPDGPPEDRFVDFVYQPVTDDDGEVVCIFVQGTDVTERVRAEMQRTLQSRVLELAVRDASFAETLEELVRAVEAQTASDTLGSILLLDEDGEHLRHGAAPDLPEDYNRAVDGIAIGPAAGACGTAAWRREPVYVSDIASDPLCKDFREAALSHDLRACWSAPILSGQGKVLGTFALYYRTPRTPNEDDVALVEFAARSAALVIERKRSETALRDETRTLETLNRTGAAVAGELGLEPLVQMVTDAGVELTGAEFGAFFYNVIDQHGESYMLYTLSGADRAAFENFPMPRNTQVFAPTFEGKGVVRSPDITKDPRYGHNAPRKGMPEGHLPVRSYLAVPVIGRSGEVIGGLFFGHAETDRFTDRHERLITGIAAQAAIGIDNARLFQAAQREIEERRRAEAALRESEERLRLVQAAGGIGSFDYDLKTDTAICSPEFYSLFGLPQGSRIDRRTWFSAIHPEDRGKARAALERAIAEHRAVDHEVRIIRADTGETRWLTGRAMVLFDEDGQPWRYVGGNIDVTSRRAAEEAVRQLNEELEARVEQRTQELQVAEESLRQAQKMEAVGQLTGGIAHDFNNLLTIITGNMDIARRKLEAEGGDPRLQRAIDNAMKGAERAASLTQRLLAFSRRQPLAPKPLDVDRLVAGMSDLLKRSLGETIRLETITAPGLWQIEADPNQLESAIVNLAVNARDAMPRGGTLTIETANAWLDAGYTASQAEVAPGNYVVIAVSDTGEGMPKETLARVFEPFFTTKEVGKGTGLGLSMVYGFVKQTGGHVKVYSEEGRGTTVKIYLPRLTGTYEEPAASEAAYVLPGRDGETILVVEDDDDVRAYSVELLRELGYHVIEAHDGPAALRLLERRDIDIDLMFTDVVMPGMSGRELADGARALRPGLRILYTSGYTRNAIVHGGRLDAGVEMIPKPFTYHELSTRIRDLLDAVASGRLLIVDADPTARLAETTALVEAGFTVEQAATAAEAMGKLRAPGGGYDAVLLDTDLPDRSGAAIVREIRGHNKDVPLLMMLRPETAQHERIEDGDPCVGIVAKPCSGEQLIAALGEIGIRCARHERQS